MFLRAMALAITLVFSAAASWAVPVGLFVAGDRHQQVYRLPGGTLLGLWDIDTRGIGPAGAERPWMDGAYDIVARFVSERGRILAFYNGLTPANPGAPQFSPVAWGFFFPADTRLSGALWIEWTHGALVYRQPGERTRAVMNPGQVTRAGDPFALPQVPLQSAVVYMAGALILLGAAGRWRRYRRSGAADRPDAR